MLVSKLRFGTVKGRVIGLIHLVSIPLGIAWRIGGSDRNGSPVRIDPELGVTKPLGVPMLSQRLPIRLEGSLLDQRVDLLALARFFSSSVRAAADESPS